MAAQYVDTCIEQWEVYEYSNTQMTNITADSGSG